MEERNHSGGFSLDHAVVRGDHGSDALGVASEAQGRGQKRRTPVQRDGGRKVEQEGPSRREEDRSERGEKDRGQKGRGQSRRTQAGTREKERESQDSQSEKKRGAARGSRSRGPEAGKGRARKHDGTM